MNMFRYFVFMGSIGIVAIARSAAPMTSRSDATALLP